MWKQLIPAFRITLFLTVLTGLIYPAVITGLCQVLFRLTSERQHHQPPLTASKPVPRSSAKTSLSRSTCIRVLPLLAAGYDGTASSGSNYGPTNAKLIDRTKAECRCISARRTRSSRASFPPIRGNG